MGLNYKKIGNYIHQVDNRNYDLKVGRLLGVSMTKEFRESTSNIVGTDMSVYKVVQKGQFVCDFMSVIRVNKLPVALKTDDEPIIVSPAYPVFEVNNINELLPEYLMMWFRRPEFDRYAFFKCDSAIRGGYNWDELCDSELPVPHINLQHEIVKEYNVVVNRISLNNQIIQKLEATAKSIYKQWFIDFEFPDKNGQPYKSMGGEMEHDIENEKEIPKGWEVKYLKQVCSKIGSGSTPNGGKSNYKQKGVALIRSMNIHDLRFDYTDLAFIDDAQARKLNNVTLKEKDVLINITGVSVARCCMVPNSILPSCVNQHVSIIRANPGTNLSFYILFTLCNPENKNKLLGISQAGSTREAITKAELEQFQVLIPDKVILEIFEKHISKIFKYAEIVRHENHLLEKLKNNILSKLATLEN